MTDNTLAKLRKAQETLLQAEQNYTNAHETLNTAEKAHTEALEAFRKEAVGLLGDSFKTSLTQPQGDMRDIKNWEKGDLLLCIKADSEKDITKGNLYTYENESSLFKGYARVVNDEGREIGYPVGHCLKALTS